MHKWIRRIWMSIVLAFLFTGCTGAHEEEKTADIPQPAEETATQPEETEPADDNVIDLTRMGRNTVYAEISQMMMNPEEYAGKTIRVKGMFTTAMDKDYNTIFGCYIPDAAACCAQGLEFVLAEERIYPDEYPQENEWIILEGTFTYEKNSYFTAAKIADATIEVIDQS